MTLHSFFLFSLNMAKVRAVVPNSIYFFLANYLDQNCNDAGEQKCYAGSEGWVNK